MTFEYMCYIIIGQHLKLPISLSRLFLAFLAFDLLNLKVQTGSVFSEFAILNCSLQVSLKHEMNRTILEASNF